MDQFPGLRMFKLGNENLVLEATENGLCFPSKGSGTQSSPSATEQCIPGREHVSAGVLGAKETSKMPAALSSSETPLHSRRGEPLSFAYLRPGAGAKGGVLSTALLLSLPGLCLCRNWGLRVPSYKPPGLPAGGMSGVVTQRGKLRRALGRAH